MARRRVRGRGGVRGPARRVRRGPARGRASPCSRSVVSVKEGPPGGAARPRTRGRSAPARGREPAAHDVQRESGAAPGARSSWLGAGPDAHRWAGARRRRVGPRRHEERCRLLSCENTVPGLGDECVDSVAHRVAGSTNARRHRRSGLSGGRTSTCVDAGARRRRPRARSARQPAGAAAATPGRARRAIGQREHRRARAADHRRHAGVAQRRDQVGGRAHGRARGTAGAAGPRSRPCSRSGRRGEGERQQRGAGGVRRGVGVRHLRGQQAAHLLGRRPRGGHERDRQQVGRDVQAQRPGRRRRRSRPASARRAGRRRRCRGGPRARRRGRAPRRRRAAGRRRWTRARAASTPATIADDDEPSPRDCGMRLAARTTSPGGCPPSRSKAARMALTTRCRSPRGSASAPSPDTSTRSPEPAHRRDHLVVQRQREPRGVEAGPEVGARGRGAARGPGPRTKSGTSGRPGRRGGVRRAGAQPPGGGVQQHEQAGEREQLARRRRPPTAARTPPG